MNQRLEQYLETVNVGLKRLHPASEKVSESLTRMENLRLEQYLEQVGSKLKTLPGLEQEQQIAEIRQHLETLIAGALSQGESEAKATAEAIRQFDAENRVGADLLRVGLRGRLQQMPDFMIAVLTCLSLLHLLTSYSFLLGSLSHS